jgi:hypothetical protein
MQFAMALNPEFRGMQDAGWSTAEDASRALDQYLELLEKLASSPIKVRLAGGGEQLLPSSRTAGGIGIHYWVW